MRIVDKKRFAKRPSKRKDETESSNTAAFEPPAKRISKRIEKKNKEQKEASSSMAKSSNVSTSAMETSIDRSSNVLTSAMEPTSSKTRSSDVSTSVMGDRYCWFCHTETDENVCVTCHRVFHDSCLDKKSVTFSDLGVCPECCTESVDGTKLSSNKYFSPDKLKRILDILVRRCFHKKREKNIIFSRWPEGDGNEKLFKIIDFEILLDNINHVPPYTKAAEFYGDVKYILHNCFIAYGAHSEQAKAAEYLRRDFKYELIDLEACPECYYHMYCNESNDHPFVRICDSPHDIVWAQLTKHPFWPAKCLKVTKGIAHVRFFGKHEVSNIPINKCFFMSKTHPKFANSNINDPENLGPRSPSFKSARDELISYIDLYESRYRKPFTFHRHRTPYKPQEKTNEVSAEGSSKRSLMEMKLEGVADEDSEGNDINAVTVIEHSEDNLPFPNSDTVDITGPDGFVKESFKELSQSLHRAGNECSVGQYSPLDDIVPSLNVDPTALSRESGSNNNTSPVTSINMSFSSDENPSNIVTENPVVTSIESLHPTVSPPITLPSEGDTPLEFRMLQSETSVETETIYDSEIPSGTAANDESIASDAFADFIVSNLSEISENPVEGDNEVHYVGEERNTGATFNPDEVMEIIGRDSVVLRDIFKKARYSINGLFVYLWATCTKNIDTVGRLSKMSVDLRKCKNDLKKMKEENETMTKENQDYVLMIQSLTEKLDERRYENIKLKNDLAKAEEEKNLAKNNAKMLIRNLRRSCSKRIKAIMYQEHLKAINDIEKKNDSLETVIKSLEEQIREVKKENTRLESISQEALAVNERLEEKVKETVKEKDTLKKISEELAAKRSNEEKAKVMKLQRPGPDIDDISTFKKMHFCHVCELSAGIVCCLNTSYCGRACQERDAEDHRPFCKREISSQIMQQTFCQQTLEMVISSETVSVNESSVNNRSSDSEEISDIGSTAASSHQMKTEISTLLATSASRDKSASSSRSYSSKTKRRFLK